MLNYFLKWIYNRWNIQKLWQQKGVVFLGAHVAKVELYWRGAGKEEEV